MMLYSKGSKETFLEPEDLKEGLFEALEALGPKKKVLIIPPDITRLHSQAGLLTQWTYEYYGEAVWAVLPALGTHYPMSMEEREKMFGSVPSELFVDHNWKEDTREVGIVPASFVKEITDGRLEEPWKAEVNFRLLDDEVDLILSLGQVVPHEVIGMANHNKNIFVGTGGKEGIGLSHFIGAVCGMERAMGRADTPVRALLDYAEEHFIPQLPLVYGQTVMGRNSGGELKCQGLFIGRGKEPFTLAAKLSQEVNITLLDKPIKKAVVYLDPEEFRSTWLGGKAIYRTRLAMADGGILVIMAPGIKEFGEDPNIDALIRKYGYLGAEGTLAAVRDNEDLCEYLGAAAHLIHGCSEGRFRIVLTPGHLSRHEVEQAGYEFGYLENMLEAYPPQTSKDGWNTSALGEEYYYISNPALGLWALKEHFQM